MLSRSFHPRRRRETKGLRLYLSGHPYFYLSIYMHTCLSLCICMPSEECLVPPSDRISADGWCERRKDEASISFLLPRPGSSTSTQVDWLAVPDRWSDIASWRDRQSELGRSIVTRHRQNSLFFFSSLPLHPASSLLSFFSYPVLLLPFTDTRVHVVCR